MTLRLKFGLFVGLIVSGAAGSLTAVFLSQQTHLIKNNARETRRSQAAAFAAVCREAVLSQNDLLLANYVKMISGSDGIVYAYFTDPGGRFIAHTEKTFLGRNVRDWAAPPDALESSSVVEALKGREGTAVIGFSKSREDRILKETLGKTIRRVCGTAGIVGSVFLFGAVFFVAILTRPLEDLSRSAERIGAGDFQARVPVRGKDEVAHLADRFNTMAGSLGALDEIKDEIIAAVSHDLKTPLTLIKMRTSSLLSGRDIPADQKETLNAIQSGATRLEIFISNLLDAAKMKAGRMDFHFEPVNFGAVTRELSALFGVMAEQNNITLIADVPPDLPPFKTDAVYLAHVLENLFSNALKFTPSGGNITLTAARKGGEMNISVSDTGRGIPSEDLPFLFERFRQVQVAEQREKRIKGTGLGLHIVKQTVERLGGRIEVRSELGRGTRFTLLFPL